MVDSTNPFSLTGRVALVTGGVRGLGRAMAEAFAEAGAHVFINGRDAAALERARDEMSASGLRVSALAFDVADEAGRDRALAEIGRAAGRLDILVNNVGQRMRLPIERIAADGFREMMESNVVAAYALARAAAPMMAKGGYGRIILMSSSAAARARIGDAAYIASKGAIEALTRALACEWGRQGILTNAIAPGPFATEINAALAARHDANDPVKERSPLGRWGQPREIGPVGLFLASPASSYVNGIVLSVDGGLSIQA